MELAWGVYAFALLLAVAAAFIVYRGLEERLQGWTTVAAFLAGGLVFWLVVQAIQFVADLGRL